MTLKYSDEKILEIFNEIVCTCSNPISLQHCDKCGLLGVEGMKKIVCVCRRPKHLFYSAYCAKCFHVRAREDYQMSLARYFELRANTKSEVVKK
jgi:hypothetical protein